MGISSSPYCMGDEEKVRVDLVPGYLGDATA